MGNCMACGRFARLDPHTDECPTCKLGEGNPHPDERDAGGRWSGDWWDR